MALYGRGLVRNKAPVDRQWHRFDDMQICTVDSTNVRDKNGIK